MNRCLVPMIVVGALSLSAHTVRALPPPHLIDELSVAPDDSAAEPPPPPPTTAPLSDAELARLSLQDAKTEVITISGSPRGVAEDFLVLPSGAELGARLRLITADDGPAGGKLKLTDLALFDLHGQWGLTHGYELDAAVSVLAKQPSASDEGVWQGAMLALRRDLWARTALALSGTAAPLVGQPGYDLGASAFVAHKHRITRVVDFALAAGASATFLRPTHAVDQPDVIEGAGHAAIEVGFDRMWGGWMGVSYALPVAHHGHDPISGMALAPQPRLDLTIGNAVQLSDDWDLSVELSILDRGDRGDPATRLPLLDGGFDQIQLSIGITRRLELSRSRDARGIASPLITL